MRKVAETIIRFVRFDGNLHVIRIKISSCNTGISTTHHALGSELNWIEIKDGDFFINIPKFCSSPGKDREFPGMSRVKFSGFPAPTFKRD